VSMQDRCMGCARRTIGSEIILDAMVLSLTQDRCMVCVNCTIGSEIILDAPDGTPSGRGSCGISLLSFGDSVRVCASRTIGSEIILDTRNGTTRDEAQVEARFGPFGHTICIERTLGMDIILDAPVETPR
jgi:hypothetical protein